MKKWLIISIIINIILLLIIGYFIIDTPGVKAIKKELNEKNEKLENEKSALESKNKKLNEKNKTLENTIASKDITIRNTERKLTEKIIIISNLKKQIKKIKDFKNSNEIKDKNDCIKIYNELKLNCLKLEEENKEWTLALDYSQRINKELKEKVEIKNLMIINKDKIILNKNEEIQIEVKKRINVEKAMKKSIISMKRKSLLGRIVEIGVAITAGYFTAKLKLL